jgi:hypothetical protein
MRVCGGMHTIIRWGVVGCLALVLAGGCPPSGGGKNGPQLHLDIVGEGSVTLAPPGTTYRREEVPVAVTYKKGDKVTLTASPDAGWVFFMWAGDLFSRDNPVTITMNEDEQIAAVFVSEEMSEELADALASISQGQALTPGTWGGFIIAERTIKADVKRECRDSENNGTETFTVLDKESKRAVVKVGPCADLQWQYPMEGQYQAEIDDSYHQIAQDDSEECCGNPPECTVQQTVTPGDRFDMLTTQKGSGAYALVTDVSAMRFDVVLTIAPLDISPDAQPAFSYVEFIYPYENRQIEVGVEVDIDPHEKLPYVEKHQDSLHRACDGSIDNHDDQSSDQWYLGLNFQFRGRLIKRSDGRHEIIGTYVRKWTEDGSSNPCGSPYPREGFESCVVHLTRKP